MLKPLLWFAQSGSRALGLFYCIPTLTFYYSFERQNEDGELMSLQRIINSSHLAEYRKKPTVWPFW